jgi:uncharacterized protein YgiB involved in biofilm formation
MKYSSFPVVALLAMTIVFTGCKKKEQCDPGDTPAVCKAVQECFESGTSAVACREAEKDANQPSKDLPKATSGAADGLNYDSSKPAQKPAPKQSPQP